MSARGVTLWRCTQLVVLGAALTATSHTMAAEDTGTHRASSPGEPRCQVQAFVGDPLPPDETSGYFYEPADVRGGAECIFSVDSNLTVTVRLIGNRGDNYFERMEVLRAGGAKLQDVQLERYRLSPPRDAVYLRTDDVDFDGHRDIGLLVDYRPPANGWYKYWLFDPASGRFVEHPETDRLPNPSVDVAAKALITYSSDGGNGSLYRRVWHRFEDGHLGIFREETQIWVDGAYERTLKESSEGVLSVVSKTVVPEGHAGPYDAGQWDLVKRVTADFAGDVGRASIFLLRSREVTGESGVGGPLYEVNVVIAQGDRVLYRFWPGPPRFHDGDSSNRFLFGDRLDVVDVTGDGVPEVVFAAGYVGASSSGANRYVIHYDATRRRFSDVRHADFVDGDLVELRWMDVEGRPVALRAEAEWANGESHYEPHHYEYRAYCWRPDRGEFVRVWTTRSRDRHEDKRALDEELPRLLPDVRQAVADACEPQPRSRH